LFAVFLSLKQQHNVTVLYHHRCIPFLFALELGTSWVTAGILLISKERESLREKASYGNIHSLATAVSTLRPSS
jgi:hypothetical protein